MIVVLGTVLAIMTASRRLRWPGLKLPLFSSVGSSTTSEKGWLS